MFNVGGGEILVILLLALVVLGPDKLPNAARQVGKYMGEFRRVSNGFQEEVRSAMRVADTSGARNASTSTPSAGSGTSPPSPATPDASTGASTAPAVEPARDVTVEGPSGSFS